MGLLVIMDSDFARVNDFYKSLLYNTQALETMGRLNKFRGMAKNVVKKLKEIKADLVRGNEGWQDCDLTPLIAELKKWRDISPVEENAGSKRNRKLLITEDRERRKRYVCIVIVKIIAPRTVRL